MRQKGKSIPNPIKRAGGEYSRKHHILTAKNAADRITASSAARREFVNRVRILNMRVALLEYRIFF
jgi:hypothetical protein